MKRVAFFVLVLLLGCGAPTVRPEGAVPAGSVIDMHVHVVFDRAAAAGMSADRPPLPEAVVGLLADRRLARVGAIVIAPQGDPDAVVAQNDQLFALVKAHPQLFAIASVHPADGVRALEEVDRVAGLGARMLKLHQNTQHFDLADSVVGAVVERAGARGLPVLFEGTMVLDPGTVGKILMLAATHPKARLVMAHMGHAEFAQMLVFAQLTAYPWWPRNVYFDTSTTATLFADSPYAPHLAWTIRRLGVDRVMFGSDFPVSTPGEALDALVRLGFDAQELKALTHDTAATLLKL